MIPGPSISNSFEGNISQASPPVESIRTTQSEVDFRQSPSIKTYPERAQALIGEIAKGLEAVPEDKVWNYVAGRIPEKDNSYLPLWIPRELLDKIEQRGLARYAVTLFGENERQKRWGKWEEQISKGKPPLLVHTTTRENFRKILSKGSLASRAKHSDPSFSTGELKRPDQEKNDISFSALRSSNIFGEISFVIPVDAALKEGKASFCESDGYHLIERDNAPYYYTLDKPFVVVVGDERVIDEVLENLKFDQDRASTWKERHVIIANPNAPEHNAALTDKNPVKGTTWKLGTEDILSKVAYMKLQEQGYRPTNVRFVPTGDTNDLGIKGEQHYTYTTSPA